ncbi:MAG: hypothetical protein KGI80_05125 [Verrucomicrobiota bacterium]|nr:hypothetical protein [Verrucomicrobiota bacterium]
MNLVWVLALCFVWTCSVEAVPAFARNLGVDCTTCHTAFPQLNEFGKIFLESEGAILVQKEFGKMRMSTDIIAGNIYLLPIDKRFSADSKKALTASDTELQMLSYDEVDFYLTGRIEQAFYFNVFSATYDEGFSATFDHGWAAYTMLDNNLNVYAGYTPPFHMDGNDTVHHENVFNRQWKAAEYTPDDPVQVFGLNGLTEDFFWIASWMGGPFNSLGNDPQSVAFRTVGTLNQQSFGAYFSRQLQFNETKEESDNPFLLYGLDWHFRTKNGNGMNLMSVLGFRKLYGRKTDWDLSIEVNQIFDFQSPEFKSPGIAKYVTEIIPMINMDFFVDRTTGSSELWIQGSVGSVFNLNPAIRIFPQLSGTVLAPSSYKHYDLQFLISADMGL